MQEERPDLEELKAKLVMQNAAMRKEMAQIEDKILELLSLSKGDILDDEELIGTLAASKETSEEISAKVKEAEVTEKEIDTTRMGYVPVAVRSAVLYFGISDMGVVDPMYQYSLGWFMNLFRQGIRSAPSSPDLPVRLQNINEYFTYSLYLNVCRSLFERHKLLFSFLLYIRIHQGMDEINPEELKFLLAGPVSTVLDFPNPAPEWMTENMWVEATNLGHLTNFEDFHREIAQYIKEFRAIFDSARPHLEPLPGKWNDNLNTFQKLLVLRAIRPDKCVDGVQVVVTESMGQKFIEPPPFDLPSTYRDSTPATPLVFVLSAGADPAADLWKFAEEMRFTRKLDSISLGQGQGPIAEKMIADATQRGAWVLLQNVHLAVSWLPNLEKICEHINPDQVHRDFRLWLTSMPSKQFPVSILQDGVKMTNEPPKGLRANLRNTWVGYDDKFLETSEKPDAWRALLFGVTMLHAIVQDRRKFGALGWNIAYEFAQGDLFVCIQQLQLFLDDYETIPFKVLRYLFGEINYGGRVTDDKDRRLLNDVVSDYQCEEILDPDHKMSPSGIYYVPQTETVAGFLEYIEGLPINPAPEVFGLHSNADITCAQNETYAMLETLLSMQPRSSAAGGKSADEIIADISKDVLGRMPKALPLDAVIEKYPVDYSESMNTVIQQEVIRYNGLLKIINSSLNDLLKAIKGLVVMSETLEALATGLNNNQIPSMWAGKAYPSLKPLAAWLVDLEKRLHFVNFWIKGGTPTVFWISGFFFPQAFMTGALQNYARKYTKSIDSVSFSFRVIDKRLMPGEEAPTSIHGAEPWLMEAERPDDGVLISGLFMEGARWSSHNQLMDESRPKELFTEFPIMHLQPVADRVIPTTGFYFCPIYKTLTRAGTLSTTGHSTNYVLSVEIPSDLPQKHWIKRGVAMFCALKY